MGCLSEKTPRPISVMVESVLPIVVELPDEIRESSGIILSGDKDLWTHNDSGDKPNLYKISLEEKKLKKTVYIKNASNEDWESITEDENFVYIGDTGNNNGTRQDLAIHKILKTDLATEDSIVANSIFYNYEDQTDFTSSNNHNFDCEALIPIMDKLFLFSKNRGNLQTNIYTLPNEPGTYTAALYDTLHVCLLYTSPSPRDS